jgi:hypothetical protein
MADADSATANAFLQERTFTGSVLRICSCYIQAKNYSNQLSDFIQLLPVITEYRKLGSISLPNTVAGVLHRYQVTNANLCCRLQAPCLGEVSKREREKEGTL